MNVYDFDETIYDGDSTRDFVVFLLRRQPSLLGYIPGQVKLFLDYSKGKITKTAFKEGYYGMFAGVKDIDLALSDFWQEYKSKIKPYYLEQQRPDDLIISASPEFLLQPICDHLGITGLLASRIDRTSGACQGENCHGSEKVRRFLAAGYDENDVEGFYSDSCSDFPLAELAQQAYMVQGDKVGPWEKPKKKGFSAFMQYFNDRSFLQALLQGSLALFGVFLFVTILMGFLPSLFAIVFGTILGFVLVAFSLRLGKEEKFRAFKEKKAFSSFAITVVAQYSCLIFLMKKTWLSRNFGLIMSLLFALPLYYTCLVMRNKK